MNTSTRRQLSADLKAVVEDAEALLEETADDTGTRLSGVRDRLGESLRNARSRAIDLEESVRAQTRAAATSTDRYVHENPWRTIGIVAAASVLIGLLIGRKARDI